jgi:hypothetical protein
VELTGTNRSNPPDPFSFVAQARERGKTARVQRQAPTGSPTGAPGRFPPGTFAGPRHCRWAQDTSPHIHKSPRAPNPNHSKPGGASPGGLASLVATARGQTPDPIPNSAVKTLSADGTAAQAAEEQVAARLAKPPTPNQPPPPTPRRGAISPPASRLRGDPADDVARPGGHSEAPKPAGVETTPPVPGSSPREVPGHRQ